MSVAKKLSKQILDQNLLKSFFPLNRLSATDLHEIEENSTIKQLSRGQLLFEKGSNDEFAYFLLLGEIELLAETNSTLIKSGTTQAKFPISDARPRQSTALAKTNTSVLCVNTNLLDLLLNHDQNTAYSVSDIQTDVNNDWLTVFLQSLASMKIPAKNIQALIQHMEEIEVKAGETVIRQSESDDHYYIIKEGRCAITRKASEQYTEVRLAELSQGSGFGEEALITNGTRTATVTMINDGRLMRLNKADFLDLLVEPLMNFVNVQDGLALVEKGAVLLDVRTMTEHTKDGLKNSINIPLPVLRLKIKELDQRKNYIVFCDNGSRSSAAAFLLTQNKFNTYLLEGGLNDIPHDLRAQLSTKPDHRVIDSLSNIPIPDFSAASISKTDLEKPRFEDFNDPGLPSTDNDPLEDDFFEFTSENESSSADDETWNNPDNETDYDDDRTWEETIQQLKQENYELKAELEKSQIKKEQESRKLAKTVSVLRRAEEELTRLKVEDKNIDSQVESALLKANKSEQRAQEFEQGYNQAQNQIVSLNMELAELRSVDSQKHEIENETVALRIELEKTKARVTEEINRAKATQVALKETEQLAARLRNEVQQARMNADREMSNLEESAGAETTEKLRLETDALILKYQNELEHERLKRKEEARKSIQAEMSRKRAIEESEQKIRDAFAIKQKAEEESIRLKAEIVSIRFSAEESTKNSVQAETAKKLAKAEEETQRARVAEQEVTRLKAKLEAQKRASLKKKQAQLEANNKHNQFTNEKPSLSIENPALDTSEDVGKIQNSGWISDAMLWETTLGLREDSEAEKYLSQSEQSGTVDTSAHENSIEKTKLPEHIDKSDIIDATNLDKHHAGLEIDIPPANTGRNGVRKVPKFSAHDPEFSISRDEVMSGTESKLGKKRIITILGAISLAIIIGGIIYSPDDSTPKTKSAESRFTVPERLQSSQNSQNAKIASTISIRTLDEQQELTELEPVPEPEPLEIVNNPKLDIQEAKLLFRQSAEREFEREKANFLANKASIAEPEINETITLPGPGTQDMDAQATTQSTIADMTAQTNDNELIPDTTVDSDPDTISVLTATVEETPTAPSPATNTPSQPEGELF